MTREEGNGTLGVSASVSGKLPSVSVDGHVDKCDVITFIGEPRRNRLLVPSMLREEGYGTSGISASVSRRLPSVSGDGQADRRDAIT